MKSVKKSRTKKAGTRLGRKLLTEASSSLEDLASLRQPTDTSVSTLWQATKLFENGSNEIKSILTYECELIYECRVCRSLFRSLLNLISHKRIYCKDKFDITFSNDPPSDCDMVIVQGDKEKESEDSSMDDKSVENVVPQKEAKRDLSYIVNMLQKKQSEAQIILEKSFNSSAVYQTVSSSPSQDLMKAQTSELEIISKRETGILGADGRLVENGKNVMCNKIIGKERSLSCTTCNSKFLTNKTLALHIKTFHAEQRLCYPCPYCASTFTNTWSVYRHLFKVHKKNNEQVRKLRSQIQQQAFRKDVEEPKREQPKKEERTSVNETQEWIEHLESDAELQRCGGCGKRFDRKAALSSHLQYCQRRIAAYNELTRKKPKIVLEPLCIPSLQANLCKNSTPKTNIHKSIESEKQKEPTGANSKKVTKSINHVKDRSMEALETALATFACQEENETSIRVESVTTLSKADWEMLETNGQSNSGVNKQRQHMLKNSESLKNESNCNTVSPNTVKPITTKEPVARNSVEASAESNNSSDLPEIIYTSIEGKAVGSKRRKLRRGIKETPPAGVRLISSVVLKDPWKSRGLIQSRSQLGYVEEMEKKLASLSNLEKLKCLPCKRKFTSVTNLRRHVATHIGWNRYRCKLCDYKCFVKCDCVAHCNKMHNAQNDRTVIAEMIAQITEQEYQSSKNVEERPAIDEIVESMEVIRVSPGKESELKESSEDSINQQTENNIQQKELQCLGTQSKLPETKEGHVFEEKLEKGKNEKVVTEESVELANKRETEAKLKHQEKSEPQKINTEKSTKRGHSPFLRRQNIDPELRRMVMQVIFGTEEEESSKEKEASCTDSKLADTEFPESNEKRKICSTSPELTMENQKAQRPIRKKVKPLNKDFIYDLKEVPFRKNPLILKGGFNTGLNKKSLLQIRPEDEDCNTQEETSEFKGFTPVNGEVSLLVPTFGHDVHKYQVKNGGLFKNFKYSSFP